MITSFASCLLLFAVPQDIRQDDHLLATIPEDISLEGKPLIDPNGKVWPVIHRVVYGPRGERVAYVGEREGKTHAVIGEEVLDNYGYISPPIFNATGETVIFRVGHRKSKTKEEWWVLVNGEKIGKADWIGSPAISPDGTRIAYWTQPGAKVLKDGPYKRSDQVLVVQTKNGKKWKSKKGSKWDDAHSLSPPSFSADGSKITSLAMDKNKWWVVQMSKKEKELSKGDSMISDLVLDEAGKTFAFTSFDSSGSGRTGGMPAFPGGGGFPGTKMIVVWGKLSLGTRYDTAFAPALSPDGKQLAFKAIEGEAMGVVWEGGEGLTKTYEFVHRPFFAPDGKRLAYVVTEGAELDDYFRRTSFGDTQIKGGESFLATQRRAGRKIEHEEGAKWLEIRYPAFSPDGEHLAYAGRSEEGWTLVVDEQPGPFAEDVGPPRFSADSEFVGHGMRQGKELWWKVRPTEAAESED